MDVFYHWSLGKSFAEVGFAQHSSMPAVAAEEGRGAWDRQQLLSCQLSMEVVH